MHLVGQSEAQLHTVTLACHCGIENRTRFALVRLNKYRLAT